MPFQTLAQADKYSTDQIYAGLIDEIIKVSPIATMLPFDTVLGNALAYNRELALPGQAGFRALGATWDEGVHTETNVRTVLTVIGGDADLDKFLKATHSNIQDIEAVIIAEKAKAVWQNFENELVYGPSTDGFNGWHAMIGSGAQQVNMGSGATPAVATFASLDAMIDLVKPGKPDCLVMSRRTRRNMNAFARTNSTFISTQRQNDFGQFVQYYNDIPIYVSDYITDVEVIASGRFSAKTGGASSSVFALQLHSAGLHGIAAEAAGGIIQHEVIDPLETKDARRNRIKMYVSQALKCSQAIARLDGIAIGTWTN
jgi:hypothetical protein